MELIKKYISDLKNISWISYDENSDAVYYQENSVEINSNKRKSKIFKIDIQTNINSEVTDGDNDSTPKISPDGKNLAYIKKNKIKEHLVTKLRKNSFIDFFIFVYFNNSPLG